jgi:hypothetical protein
MIVTSFLNKLIKGLITDRNRNVDEFLIKYERDISYCLEFFYNKNENHELFNNEPLVN